MQQAVELARDPADMRAPQGSAAMLWLDQLVAIANSGDFEAAARTFVKDCFWRDLVAFSWSIVTAEGQSEIADMLRQCWDRSGAAALAPIGTESVVDGIVEQWFSFRCAAGSGRGAVRLKDGRGWTLFTALDTLKGHDAIGGRTRPLGTTHRPTRNRPNWRDQREARTANYGVAADPDCLIIGGGQSGMAAAARLKRLNVSTLVIDRYPRAGDAWRNRYRSLCLHDPVWYDHLPYLPFPSDWPVFTPKDKMADWLELYVQAMELDYWPSTNCQSARYDETEQRWIVSVERDGSPLTLRPKEIILAIGLHGFPFVPEIPGHDDFAGKQYHSGRHQGGPGFAGKKCVVIGSNNSAHDICLSLWEDGAHVTMLQRSPTTVVRSESLITNMVPLYSEQAVEAGIDADRADEITASYPYRVLAQMHCDLYDKLCIADADYYARLAGVGFQFDFGIDGTGLLFKALRDGSGYYIDVGASDLIAKGEIKVQPGGVDHIRTHSVLLSDGTEIPADVIIYATGYQPLTGPLSQIFDAATVERIGRCWGMGSGTAKDPGPWEGELRNHWKPMEVEHLWMTGFNLALSRYYSRFLALQIKASIEGLAGAPYRRSPH
jgi:putative flavoprotein involved in K+ transport